MKNRLNIKPAGNETAIWLLRLSSLFRNMLFVLPVIVLLYQSKGMSLGDFFLIQGIFGLAHFLFEIPSGYLSDVFSRKKILCIGFSLWVIGYIVLYFGNTFWWVLTTEAIWGIGLALITGTQEAYTYDLLKRIKREKSFLKEEGRIQTYMQAGSAIGALTGSALYAVIGGEIILLTIAVSTIAFGMVLFLPELPESRRKVVLETSPLKDILGIVKFSVKHPEIKWFMLYPALLGACTLALMWLLQPTMESVGIPVAFFGIFVSLNLLSRVMGAHQAHHVFDYLGVRKSAIMPIGIILIGLICALAAQHVSNPYILYTLITVLAIVPAVQMMFRLVFASLIHHRIQSNERGTVLSISQMVKSACNSIMMILMKFLLDGAGITTALICIPLFLILALYPLRQILKVKENV